MKPKVTHGRPWEGFPLTAPGQFNKREMIDKAIRALLRYCERKGLDVVLPGDIADKSYCDGRQIVILQTRTHDFARYQITNSGCLRVIVVHDPPRRA